MLEYLLHYLMTSAQPRARRDATGALVLEYGRAFRVVFIAAAVVWIALLAFMCVDSPPKPEDMPVMLALAAFEIAPIAVLITIYRWSIRLTDAGIGRRSPWTRDLDASWSQIQSVRYNRVTKEFVIDTAVGKIRAPRCLNGLATLRAELERHVPLPCWSAAQQELDGASGAVSKA